MDAVTPVLLHQTQMKHPQPILRILLRRNNLLSKHNKSHKLSCYDDFQLVVQELDIHLEQQTVIAAHETAQKTFHIWVSTFPSLFDTQEGGLRTASGNERLLGKGRNTTDMLSSSNDDHKLYIDRFYLNPIKINISFLMTPGAVTQHRDRSQHKEASLRYSGTGVFFAFSSFLRQVGEVVLDLSSNISNAPILIGGMRTENLFMSNRELTNKLQVIYFQSIVSQVRYYYMRFICCRMYIYCVCIYNAYMLRIYMLYFFVRYMLHDTMYMCV